ncbi:hypothetical protein [Tomitella biformata]|uniref:hypothetical protein n=1 Tax=Tomitella biformata TaxID=630403 RepID=UPI000465D1CE|nr:hypothetical protein [Tomitella biformata]
MNSILARAAMGAVATAALAGTLLSCSSATEAPEAAPVSAETTAAQAPGPTEPASTADEAAMSEVFQRYLETSNAGQAQAYLATVCASDPVHSQGITDSEPNPYPMSLVGMKDFTVDGDDGLATVTVKIGLEESADNITQRFTFVRANGAWTVCGEQGK